MVFGFVLSSEVKKLTRFCAFNLLTVCHAAKEKYNFLFLTCYTLQVEFFLLIFFYLLAVHLLNFK